MNQTIDELQKELATLSMESLRRESAFDHLEAEVIRMRDHASNGLSHYDFNTMLIFAFRYALKRQTGASLVVSRSLVKCWDRFDSGEQTQIQQDIKNAMKTGAAIADDWQEILDLQIKTNYR